MGKAGWIVGIAGAVGLVWLFKGSKAGASGKVAGGSIQLQISGPQSFASRGYGALDPTTPTEGQQATLTAFVTNTSVFEGTSTPAPYTFSIALYVVSFALGITTPLLNKIVTLSVPAGGSSVPSATQFAIPMGAAGLAVATADLFTTDGKTEIAAQAKLTFTINAAAPPVVVPGGSINF